MKAESNQRLLNTNLSVLMDRFEDSMNEEEFAELESMDTYWHEFGMWLCLQWAV